MAGMWDVSWDTRTVLLLVTERASLANLLRPANYANEVDSYANLSRRAPFG